MLSCFVFRKHLGEKRSIESGAGRKKLVITISRRSKSSIFEMDLVDIDKVLDDLELNEDNTCRRPTVVAPAIAVPTVDNGASIEPGRGKNVSPIV